MALDSVLIAIILGVIQGLFEWLPISSEGNVALALASLGESPATAVRVALFLHLGTALAATTYYHEEIRALVSLIPQWHKSRPFTTEDQALTFLVTATVLSGIVGIGAYVLLIDAVSALAGGAFIVLIGGLLVLTGVIQRTADTVSIENSTPPTLVDAVLIGVGQGLAILPGVSRSGTTVSVLLLRGHDGETSFDLSFLLSIPAAVGAGILAILDTGFAGTPTVWLTALLVSAGVGYLTIGALLAVVRRVEFWAVCIGMGGLSVIGGLVVWLG